MDIGSALWVTRNIWSDIEVYQVDLGRYFWSDSKRIGGFGDQVEKTFASRNITSTQQTRNNTSTQETRNITSTQQTRNITSTQETRNITSTQETRNITSTQETRNITSTQQTRNITSTQETRNITSTQQTRNITSTQQTRNITSTQETSSITSTQQTRNITSTQETRNITSTQQTRNNTDPDELFEKVRSLSASNQENLSVLLENLRTEEESGIMSRFLICDFYFSLDYIKKLPQMSRHITSPHAGNYREGKEFEVTEEILGKGNCAGDIIVVKDKVTGSENAFKTYKVTNEIIVDLPIYSDILSKH
ncbi:hypothetical protein KUTeg_015144 [Tegillarca granosa]|uniref:Uncharacterized protein n=1 Tax=Tegillarca granosa TaxID=220873 RepID=A0ABQ9ETV6_TEGGR|nr:hypothetical protein KUTeg_015144 [Tegillarca granosa]